MECPFPGMDPYIERPAIWPDFHDRLITHLSESLQPQLRPRYVAVVNDRVRVVERDRLMIPDVSLVRTSRVFPGPAVAVAEEVALDEPQVLEMEAEEIRQPLVHIVEAGAGNRIVTAIEVISPDNKRKGNGRDDYVRKRGDLWQSGANFVEIDLLREGPRLFRSTISDPVAPMHWHYLVAASRQPQPGKYELYHCPLSSRLPRRARIPLAGGDPDVVLDLQSLVSRCWQSGPYPELLRYHEPPPGPLSEEELLWCRQRLVEAGLVTSS